MNADEQTPHPDAGKDEKVPDQDERHAEAKRNLDQYRKQRGEQGAVLGEVRAQHGTVKDTNPVTQDDISTDQETMDSLSQERADRLKSMIEAQRPYTFSGSESVKDLDEILKQILREKILANTPNATFTGEETAGDLNNRLLGRR